MNFRKSHSAIGTEGPFSCIHFHPVRFEAESLLAGYSDLSFQIPTWEPQIRVFRTPTAEHIIGLVTEKCCGPQYRNPSSLC